LQPEVLAAADRVALLVLCWQLLEVQIPVAVAGVLVGLLALLEVVVQE